MAINLSDNLLIQTAKPIDTKYGPYYGSGASYALALQDAKDNAITGLWLPDLTFRFVGLTVGLILTVNGTVQPIVEYHFAESIGTGVNPPTNPNDTQFLVEKSGGSVGGSGTVGTLPKWGTTTTELTDSIVIESSGKIGIGAAPVSRTLEVDGQASAKGIDSLTLGTVTIPSVVGWYRVMKWGGTSRGGSVLKLSTVGGAFTPTTYVINAYKTFGVPAATNTLKLEQYGNAGYISKARIATDSTDPADTYLEIYNEYVGDDVFTMELYHDSLLGHDNLGIPIIGTLVIGANSLVDDELPFVFEGTSVEKLYAENVNLLNLQINNAQGSANDVLTSNGSGVEWKAATGGVSGSGVAGKLARWNTTTELDESCVDEATTGIVNMFKIGGNAATDTVSYFDTANRTAGIRTTTPTTGFPFDVNTSMRVGSELNVGFSSERNLVVQGFTTSGEPSAGTGYVEMGSYGQGNINGHPSSFKDPQSSTLRMSTGFGREGRVVDNYIYDTFEITLAALQALGNTPTTGVVLVNTPATLTCILADFWFYRQINTDPNNPTGYSDMGSWEDGELVISPSNDLSVSSISSPYEQGYFRVTNDFLTTPTSGVKFTASTALYQGNINGIDQGGMNGAWQIGNESFAGAPSAPPLGNKVYLSMATGQNPPTFAASSTTRFFIGLKYRFLSINAGIVSNPDLITIDAQIPVKTHDYQKCSEASSASCDNMPQAISIADTGILPVAAAVFEKTSTGDKCCYEFINGGFQVADTDYTIIGTFEECGDLPPECQK